MLFYVTLHSKIQVLKKAPTGMVCFRFSRNFTLWVLVVFLLSEIVYEISNQMNLQDNDNDS
jgi:hypothetical protein